MSTALLDGLVIVDVTESLDGGFCARLLADMGAHVVRCEPRTADRPAAQDPRRLAEAIHVHRGKTIQQVERVSPDDADVRRLLVSADLLVDDGGPDGFVESADDLAREHPDLVVTTISGFGRMAGWPGRPAPDLIRQAASGFSYQGGVTGGGPLRAGANLSLYVTGVAAASASLVALLAKRRRTAGAQRVDVSGVGVMLAAAGPEIARYSYGGRAANYERGSHDRLPATIMRCSDGYVGVNIANQKQWRALCELADAEHVLQDPVLGHINYLRGAEDQELAMKPLRDFVAQYTGRELAEMGQAHGVALSEIPTANDVLTSPQHGHRGFFSSVDVDGHGPVAVPRVPFVWRTTKEINPVNDMTGEGTEG